MLSPRMGMIAACSLVAALASQSRALASPDPIAGCARRPVDLVICLDTSNSMDNMINSARARLWDVVNELSRMKPTPALRVGLLSYGTPTDSSASSGWVKRQIDLTNDLDSVYGKMMALSTNGGDEFVGWVLNDALRTMSWSRDPAALKLIFVAGNESADQAAESFNFRRVCQDARRDGIVINAIYGGGRDQGISEKWNEVAQHGSGSFSPIDMQKATAQIETPQDKILIELNAKLNATYVAFGSRGREAQQNQMAQDENAVRLGSQSASARVAAKSTSQYTNSYWDLVDAYSEAEFNHAGVKKEDLPANMQNMSLEERDKYIAELRTQRAKIQAEIKEANVARERVIAEKRKAQPNGAEGLDDAMLKALREQAKAKGFEVDAN